MLIALSCSVINSDAQFRASDSVSTSYLPVQFSLTHLYGEGDNEAGVTTEAFVRSNAVELPFSISLLRNEFIDDDLKKETSDGLKNRNVLEEGYDLRFYGSWVQEKLLYKGPALYSVDYSFGSFTSAQFTEALFNTIFFGNAYYAGDTADFSDSRSHNYEYDRIGFSATKMAEGERSHWQAGIKLSLMSIHSATHVNLDRGWLYTEESGEFLSAGYDFEYSVSDSSNHGTFQIDGMGPVVDIMMAWSDAPHRWQVTGFINNLGTVFWNNNTITYYADSAATFEGISASNILSLDDSSVINYSVDSLLKYTGTSSAVGSKSFPLPVQFAAQCGYRLSAHWVIQAGMSYRPYPDLLPLFFTKARWISGRSFEAGSVLSYGGTARYALGFDVKAQLGSHVIIAAASENVLGVFMPSQTSSTSLFLQAAIKF